MDSTFGNHLIFITGVWRDSYHTSILSEQFKQATISGKTGPHQRKTLALELIHNNDQQGSKKSTEQ